VGIENAARIFQAARHPKSFVSLDQADHLLSNLADARYVGAVIAAWAMHYIAAPSPKAAAVPAAETRITAPTGRGGLLKSG
jgi:putative redox protein